MGRLLLRSVRAVGSGIRTGWLLLGITLVLIVVCEAGLRLVLTTRDRLMDRPPLSTGSGIPDRAVTDARQGGDGLSDYSTEFKKVIVSVAWHPYVYSRNTPHRGRYINVDRNGLRATWNPSPRDNADDPLPVRVFIFGGSTLWGWGARDDHTIPSYLSKLLHGQGYRAEVMNYGQIGYVSTQEVITLLRCIQRGEVPDIVLFYDGLNDVFASYKNGAAGVSRKEMIRRAEFNLSRRPQQLAQLWGPQVLAGEFRGFHRLVTGLQRRIRPQPPPTGPLSDELVRQTVGVYEANLAIVESWGRSYGFDPLFYWQPNIFSKRHHSPYEQFLVGFDSLIRIRKAYNAVYQRVRQSEFLNGHPRFRNISTLFDDAGESYYLDVMQHLSEAGNRRVAAAMVGDVIELIERRRAAAEEKTEW